MPEPRRRPRATPELHRRAVQLRQDATPTEVILWEKLRNRRLCNLKFRRQHMMKPFILDFYCPEHSLAVEIDGSVHDLPAQQIYDGTRQAKLEMQGIRFLRFSTERVMADLDVVLREIAEACSYPPHPVSTTSKHPSPHCVGRGTFRRQAESGEGAHVRG